MSPARKPTVLLADDEEDIRASLKMILEYEGYLTLEAASGPDALRRIEESRPDAVILDIKMPRMDGLEVLAEIRNRGLDPPVIVVSGHGTIATAVEATRLGAFDFMEKPLDRNRVMVTVRNALERRRMWREVHDLRRAVDARWELLGSTPVMPHTRAATRATRGDRSRATTRRCTGS